MGTQEEEAAAMDRIIQESIKREAERLAAEEAARKAAEQQGQNSMVADGAATVGWPDNEVEQKPQSGLGKVAGALRVGKEGDVAFARDLLNSGQAPLGSATGPAASADGAKDQAAGARAAKPALGLG
jgi:hypothetical protein